MAEKFISHAQNCEDVMLWRCFKDIECGFYLDAGAAWPILDSVTYAFYQRGWRGINIEPNPTLHALLQQKRPQDLNINCAVGDQSGSLDINIFENAGLSTCVKDIAETHKVHGQNAHLQTVPLRTMKEICDEYISQGQKIQYLKIDVEGMERETLLGFDFVNYRPQVILIESTMPMLQVPCHEEWEGIILDSGYVFAYFDGLNRFYISSECEHLKRHFKVPPNLWDNYIRREVVEKNSEIMRLQSECQAAERRGDELQNKLEDVYNTKVWRYSRYLRKYLSI